ncbi:amino acid-binding protein [Paraprevotella clara]|uniref:amino acid-binding protein n=1 Tax=Paraprevotella clara TaxID=454154 RepID=UPI003AB41921
MTVHQISIFVENKSGTLLRVLDLFKEAGVQLIASTISDTVEYGIYRIICSEPTRAYEVLRAAGISASMSEVFAITLDNRPGRAADAVRVITGEGIGISYLYSFLLGGMGILVFRTDDAARTEEVIRVHQLGVLDDEALMALV